MPSPALMMGMSRCCAIRCGAPADGWRMTMASAPPRARCSRCRAATRLFQCSIPRTAPAWSSRPATWRQSRTKIACAWKLRKTKARCACRAAAAGLQRIHAAGQLQQAQDFLRLKVLDPEQRTACRLIHRVRTNKKQTVHHTRQARLAARPCSSHVLRPVPAPGERIRLRLPARRRQQSKPEARTPSRGPTRGPSLPAFFRVSKAACTCGSLERAAAC
jgi:hypothetical protein